MREKRLQMDLDKEVKDFVLKLTKQHKNKSRHRLKLRRSICTRYVDDSTTGLPESTYLSRLISSPFYHIFLARKRSRRLESYQSLQNGVQCQQEIELLIA